MTGADLLELRNYNQLTQKEFCKAIGMSRNPVAEAELDPEKDLTAQVQAKVELALLKKILKSTPKK